MFVNTLVLRTSFVPRDSFVDLLDQVRSVDLEAFAHADVPFEAIVERVQPVRSQAFAALAQVTVSVLDQKAAEQERAEIGGWLTWRSRLWLLQ